MSSSVTAEVSAPAISRRRGRAARAIFWAGLVAGTLDLAFAITYAIVRGRTAASLLKTVAGGALGRSAQQGGAGVAALGVAFHFTIAFTAAAVFCGLTRLFPVLLRFAAVAGMIYGLLVYLFMNMVVLPLSAYHTAFKVPAILAWDAGSHVFFVGLTIGLITKAFSPSSKAQ